MAERSRTNRLRQPLGELRNRTNTPPISLRGRGNKKAVTSSSPATLPHNESLEPNGSLAVRSHPDSPPSKRATDTPGEHATKRCSAISSASMASGHKRLSAISTASTTASGGKRKAFIGHWQLGKTIGKGGCSRVRIVRHRHRDQFGAVKIVTRHTAENTRAQSLANLIESTKGSTAHSAAGHKPIPHGLEREIAVMKLLEHPNIVRLYDVWENRNELYLIMEYVDGGELFHYVDKRKGLAEPETVYIFRQIISALLYCHRMMICHRDLKPENILLDQKDMSVKLIDFGMAALQPEGRLLSTPCGSPHYAAPEVISTKPYDGTQADVWSCGVILYVMLTGTTPYNYVREGDMRTLFHVIGQAKFWMPPDLSLEAKDLIRRIFVTNPTKRITMDEVWDHPLLHKYDKKFGLEGPEHSKEAAIGPGPRLDQWKVKRIQDIDREILRNMRTLWHSEPEQSLVQKLLNNELNQEKLFYAALIKHREENLENYVGEPDDMSYSASDYHHSPAARVGDAPPLPSDMTARSQSQYSILNDEHLRKSQSFGGSPPSIRSYDPYRSSKNPVVDARGSQLNVVVHHNGHSSGRRDAGGKTLRHPNSMRIEMLKQHDRRGSSFSTSSLPRSGRSRVSMPRSSMSRNSLNSSVWPSSPPVIAATRPSDVHKRGVSFSHIRRASAASGVTSRDSTKAKVSSSLSSDANRDPQMRLSQMSHSSPVAHADQAIRSRKERMAAPETPRNPGRKLETPGHSIRNEIRKHSAELEKACQEAFFRSSVGSDLTAQTAMTDALLPYETPPSSISAHPVDTTELDHTRSKSARPLPELPRDTPNTYLTKALEETREKLAAFQANPHDNTAKFDEVMRLLENIMPTASPSSRKRIPSAPEPKTSEQFGFLPIITEESDPRSSKDGVNWQRSATAPVYPNRKTNDGTIRMVPPSSPEAVAPLNVRKRNHQGRTNDQSSPTPILKKPSGDTSVHVRTNDHSDRLPSINEDSALGSPTLVGKKRSRLFSSNNKKAATRKPSAENESHPADRKGRASSRVLTKDMPATADVSDPPVSAASSEFPMRKKKPSAGKKALKKWMKRIRPEKASGEETPPGTEDPVAPAHHSLDSLFSTASATASSHDAPPPASTAAGPARSWFARFFHLKPATHILCFALPRGRARQELLLLLTEWQRHGIRDVRASRADHTLTARVAKGNALAIRPVSFRVELFVVLEHGRRSGLSIARFVQVTGAASGFRKVLDVVDGVMRGRGWLVEDEEKWKALCDVVSAC